MKKNNKSLTIGYLTTSLYDQYQNSIWAGVQDQASLLGLRVVCFVGEEHEAPDIMQAFRNSVFRLISRENIDGLLVLSGALGLSIDTGTAGVKDFFNQYPDLPAVSIGVELPGVMSVIIDNTSGMKKLVSHLIEVHQCKRIAFIKGPENHVEAMQRYHAYKQALAEHGLGFDPNLISPGSFEIDSGPKGVQYLLDEKKVSFDALVGVDDLTITNTIEPLKLRGIRIPEDIKIGGFDDVENSQSTSPPLTTVRQPLFELGKISVKKVFELVQKKTTPHVHVMPTTLMIRNSCGCSFHKMLDFAHKDTDSTPLTSDISYNISASIISRLEYIFGFDLSHTGPEEFPKKLNLLLEHITNSIAHPSGEKKLSETLRDIVTSPQNKGMTVSLWKEVLACIFHELMHHLSTVKEHEQLHSLWNKTILDLYQIEAYLQTVTRNAFIAEYDAIQYLSDRLTTSFNLDEIRKLLKTRLPIMNIYECYISFFEPDKDKSCLIFDIKGKYQQLDQKIVFPSCELIPGGLDTLKNDSFCVLPLESSENDLLGFILFKTIDAAGKKYDTLARKIASAINGARLVEKIQRQNIALRKSEEDLQITLNSIGDAVIATDAESKIMRMNPVAEKLTGWSALESLGRPLMTVFYIIDADSRKDIQNPVDRIIREGRVVNLTSNIMLVARDGTERRIADSCAPIRNPQGKVIGAVLVFRDITEQFRIEEQLRQSQKMESIGLLAGGIAHDFNNMLAGISGAAQLLAQKLNGEEKLQKYTSMIVDATGKAAVLIQKLLAFSRKVKIRHRPVDIHACINDAIEILLHSIDRRITITRKLKADSATVIGDHSQIQNAVLNLSLNARDAMPDGGELTISTVNVDLPPEYCAVSPFAVEPGSFIEILVHDTGIGMSQETMRRIFDPFFSTKEVSRGYGLGLAAVYGIVCDHHGCIEVSSELKKGTVFSLYLPVDKDAIVSKKIGKTVIQKGTGSILVVDDESIIRNTLEIFLNDLGYTVFLAKDGLEGVEIFTEKHSQINLVILDMIMPRMNGEDAFMEMRKIDRNALILLSSGFSKDTHIHELLGQGAAGFLQKPYTLSELSQMLHEIITHRTTL